MDLPGVQVMIHPARTMPFNEVQSLMAEAKAQGLVSEQVDDNLRLYCYTKTAVFDRVWTPATTMARGLILDHQRVVATPFPKFFNIGEMGQSIPDHSFETFEKVDGSLIIIFWYNGMWRTATKGSLKSEQAQWAARKLAVTDLSGLIPGTTYLAEAIYPENRIVVHYKEQGLVLLGGYDADGHELSHGALLVLGDVLGWRVAVSHSFSAVSDLLAHAGTLTSNEEGFVLRFENGLRLKIKGDEYKRIHALVSRLTPLAMWEAMAAGDDLTAIRRDLPEEFWADFDGIVDALTANVLALTKATRAEAEAVEHLSDKEVGLRLKQFPSTVRPFIFPFRRNNGDLLTGRARQAIFRAIRPTGNKLDGYVSSYAVNRVMEEAT